MTSVPTDSSHSFGAISIRTASRERILLLNADQGGRIRGKPSKEVHAANTLESASGKELNILLIAIVVWQVKTCALLVIEYCCKPERWIRNWPVVGGHWSPAWLRRDAGVIFSIEMKPAGQLFWHATEGHLCVNAAERILDVLERNQAYWYIANELPALIKLSERRQFCET